MTLGVGDEPQSGKIVVPALGSEFLVERFHRSAEQPRVADCFEVAEGPVRLPVANQSALFEAIEYG